MLCVCVHVFSCFSTVASLAALVTTVGIEMLVTQSGVGFAFRDGHSVVADDQPLLAWVQWAQQPGNHVD